MSPLTDLVTLENVHDRMPRWDPAGPSHLFALVDMGSNGIRFSISDLSPTRARLLRCLYRERAPISLFDALSSAAGPGNPGELLWFPPDTIHLVSRAVSRFRSIAVDDYGVPAEHVTVFATEAMRRAQNAASMLEAIGSEAPGLTVHILAPEVETLFGSVGARSSFVDVRGLLLDLGGGSVQMTYMDTIAARANPAAVPSYEIAAARAGRSLPFGAARLSRVLDGETSEAQEAEISKLQLDLRRAYQDLQETLISPERNAPSSADHRSGSSHGVDIYLCGGGFRGYGSMLMHNDPVQPYPIPLIGAYTVPGDRFAETKKMLQVNKSYKDKIFGMSKRRRAQFPAIVAVVDALVRAVPDIRSVTFCAGGNREGALMMKLPRDIRESNPLDLLPELLSSSLFSFSAALHARPVGRDDALQAVATLLQSALPPGTTAPTVFSLGLGALFSALVWAGSGEDSDSNASAALHDAVGRALSHPGLTHLARAVLGLTLCARWGSGLGAADQQLRDGLWQLTGSSKADAGFWAEYIGAAAAVVASVIPTWPRTPARVTEAIGFRATVGQDKKDRGIHLAISIHPTAARALDLDSLAALFKSVGKRKSGGKKKAKRVMVQIQSP